MLYQIASLFRFLKCANLDEMKPYIHTLHMYSTHFNNRSYSHHKYTIVETVFHVFFFPLLSTPLWNTFNMHKCLRLLWNQMKQQQILLNNQIYIHLAVMLNKIGKKTNFFSNQYELKTKSTAKNNKFFYVWFLKIVPCH